MARGAADGGTTQRRVSPKAIGVGVLVVLGIWWAFANSQRVRVDWIVASTTSPLVVVIAVAAIVGFVAGYLVARMSDRRP